MSADILDEAQEINQALTDFAITEIRKSSQIDYSNPTGLCFWCNSEVGTERRFCDKQCCESWERES
jgi:hypothetical protein